MDNLSQSVKQELEAAVDKAKSELVAKLLDWFTRVEPFIQGTKYELSWFRDRGKAVNNPSERFTKASCNNFGILVNMLIYLDSGAMRTQHRDKSQWTNKALEKLWEEGHSLRRDMLAIASLIST